MKIYASLGLRLSAIALAVSCLGPLLACEPTPTTTTKPGTPTTKPTTTTTKPAPPPPAGTPIHVTHSTHVSALPSSKTPHALDNDVKSMMEIGKTVYMGGSFTAATEVDKTPIDRKYLLAFDKATGKILTSFNPVLDGMVFSIVAAPDGKSLYLGGQFSNINGERHAKIARIDAVTGAPLDFKVYPDAAVTTMVMIKGKLWVGGVFKKISEIPIRVAAVDPITGSIDTKIRPTIEGGGSEGRIYRIEPRPDQKKVLVLGEFTSVNAANRNGFAKFDIGIDGSATLNPFNTDDCTYGKDVSYSPDGSYFVAVGNGGSCKAIHRFNDSNEGPGLVSPAWTTNSSADSFYAVESTGPIVYVGGHFRGLNLGLVDREGIAALEATNGTPTDWNPGRDRGRGVWEIKATPDGLYVSSDTDRIGRYYYHGRMAFFPLAGGTSIYEPSAIAAAPFAISQALPATGDVAASIASRAFDGATLGEVQASKLPASEMVNARAAFSAGKKLFVLRSNMTVWSYVFDGSAYGPGTQIDALNVSLWSDRSGIRNAFYLDGYVYYTIGSTLYRRGFSATTGMFHEQQVTVQSAQAGLPYSTMTGLWAVGNYLYFIDPAVLELRRANFSKAGGVDVATLETKLSEVASLTATKPAYPQVWVTAGKVG